jgi:hypothetical protein
VEQIHGSLNAIHLRIPLLKKIQTALELMKSKIPIRVKERKLVLTAWDLHKLKVNLNLIILEQIHGLKHVIQLKTQQPKRIQVEQEPLPIQMLV